MTVEETKEAFGHIFSARDSSASEWSSIAPFEAQVSLCPVEGEECRQEGGELEPSTVNTRGSVNLNSSFTL